MIPGSWPDVVVALGGTRTPSHRSVDQRHASGQWCRIRSRRSGSTACPGRPSWSGAIQPVCEKAVRDLPPTRRPLIYALRERSTLSQLVPCHHRSSHSGWSGVVAKPPTGTDRDTPGRSATGLLVLVLGFGT